MLHLIPVATLFTVTSVAAAGSVAVQWSIKDCGNGHWYDRLIIPSGVTWTQAGLAAITNGGHLVTLTSAEENQFVYDNLVIGSNGNVGSFGPWIGARANGTDWSWSITNEPWEYDSWASGHPNGNESNKAAGYWDPDSGLAQWADHETGEQLYSYIVEYSDDCNSDGLVDHGQILDGTLDDRR